MKKIFGFFLAGFAVLVGAVLNGLPRGSGDLLFLTVVAGSMVAFWMVAVLFALAAAITAIHFAVARFRGKQNRSSAADGTFIIEHLP